MIIIAAMLAQDVVWANPDILTPPSQNLQAPGMLRPMSFKTECKRIVEKQLVELLIRQGWEPKRKVGLLQQSIDIPGPVNAKAYLSYDFTPYEIPDPAGNRCVRCNLVLLGRTFSYDAVIAPSAALGAIPDVVLTEIGGESRVEATKGPGSSNVRDGSLLQPRPVTVGTADIGGRAGIELGTGLGLEREPSPILYLTPEEATQLLAELPNMQSASTLKQYYESLEEKDLTAPQYLAELEGELKPVLDILRRTKPRDELNALTAHGVTLNQLDILRSVSELILQLELADDGKDNLERLKYIKETFVNNPDMAKLFIEYFETRFDPGKSLDERGLGAARLRHKIRSKLKWLAGQQDAHGILYKVMRIMVAAEKTNYFVEDRAELFIRLDPRAIVGDEESGALVYSPPSTIIWVHVPYGAFGAHSRYSDLARGGLRWIAADRVADRNQILKECVSLSATQRKKHTSIAESGSKGAFTNEQGLNGIAAGIGYIYSLISCAVPDEKRIAVASGSIAADPLYLGPDEGTDVFANLATAMAKMKGHHNPRLIMTGKSDRLGGVSHRDNNLLEPRTKGNRVTSQGVMQHAFEMVRRLKDNGIIAKREGDDIILSVTGGLDGDVGSGIIERAITFYGERVKIRSIVDGSGVIFDPEGLDHKTLLEMYGRNDVCVKFPADKLHAGGFIAEAKHGPGDDSYVVLDQASLQAMNTRALDPETLEKLDVLDHYRKSAGLTGKEPLISVLEKDSGAQPQKIKVHTVYLQSAVFFITKADMLITGGGRRYSINNKNWQLFFDEGGHPAAPCMVHGANVFTEPGASVELEKRGVIIEPDEKANSVGVEISSRVEIDFNTIFAENEISRGTLRSYFEQVLAKCLEKARWKFWALRLAAEDDPGNSVVAEVSPAISEDVISLEDIIANSKLVGDRREDYSEEVLDRLEKYFPDVRKLDAVYKKDNLERIFARMPTARIKESVSKLIAEEAVLHLGAGAVSELADRLDMRKADVIRIYLKEAAATGAYKRVKDIIDNRAGLTPAEQLIRLRAAREELKEMIAWAAKHDIESGRVPKQPITVKITRNPIFKDTFHIEAHAGNALVGTLVYREGHRRYTNALYVTWVFEFMDEPLRTQFGNPDVRKLLMNRLYEMADERGRIVVMGSFVENMADRFLSLVIWCGRVIRWVLTPSSPPALAKMAEDFFTKYTATGDGKAACESEKEERPKGHNALIAAESITYEQLTFDSSYAGLSLATDDIDESALGNVEYVSQIIRQSPDSGIGALCLKQVIAETLSTLIIIGRATDAKLYKYMIEGLKRHDGIRIMVSTNLPQNSAIYKIPSGPDAGDVVLVFNREFIETIAGTWMTKNPLDASFAKMAWRNRIARQRRALEVEIRAHDNKTLKPEAAKWWFPSYDRLRTTEFKIRAEGLERQTASLAGSFDAECDFMRVSAILWPLGERLFHELSHSDEFKEEPAEVDEECECVWRDHLLYKQILANPDFFRFKLMVDGWTSSWDNAFRSNRYFAFLKHLCALENEATIKQHIRAMVLRTYKDIPNFAKPFPFSTQVSRRRESPGPAAGTVSPENELDQQASDWLLNHGDKLDEESTYYDGLRRSPPNIGWKDINSRLEGLEQFKRLESTGLDFPILSEDGQSLLSRFGHYKRVRAAAERLVDGWITSHYETLLPAAELMRSESRRGQFSEVVRFFAIAGQIGAIPFSSAGSTVLGGTFGHRWSEAAAVAHSVISEMLLSTLRDFKLPALAAPYLHEILYLYARHLMRLPLEARFAVAADEIMRAIECAVFGRAFGSFDGSPECGRILSEFGELFGLDAISNVEALSNAEAIKARIDAIAENFLSKNYTKIYSKFGINPKIMGRVSELRLKMSSFLERKMAESGAPHIFHNAVTDLINQNGGRMTNGAVNRFMTWFFGRGEAAILKMSNGGVMEKLWKIFSGYRVLTKNGDSFLQRIVSEKAKGSSIARIAAEFNVNANVVWLKINRMRIENLLSKNGGNVREEDPREISAIQHTIVPILELMHIVRSPYVSRRLGITDSEIPQFPIEDAERLNSADLEKALKSARSFLELLERSYIDPSLPFDSLFSVGKDEMLCLSPELASIFRYNLVFYRNAGAGTRILQEDLSRSISRHVDFLHNVERGKVIPSIGEAVSILTALARYFGGITEDKDRIKSIMDFMFSNVLVEEARRILISADHINDPASEKTASGDESAAEEPYDKLVTKLLGVAGDENSQMWRLAGDAHSVFRYNLRLARQRDRPTEAFRKARLGGRAESAFNTISSDDIDHCINKGCGFTRYFEKAHSEHAADSPSIIVVHSISRALASKDKFSIPDIAEDEPDRFGSLMRILFNRRTIRQAGRIIQNSEKKLSAPEKRRLEGGPLTEESSLSDIVKRAIPSAVDKDEWQLPSSAADILGYNLRIMRQRGISKAAGRAISGQDIARATGYHKHFSGRLERRQRNIVRPSITAIHNLACALAAQDDFTLDDVSKSSHRRVEAVIDALFDLDRTREAALIAARAFKISNRGLITASMPDTVTSQISTGSLAEMIIPTKVNSDECRFDEKDTVYTQFISYLKDSTNGADRATSHAAVAKRLHVGGPILTAIKEGKQPLYFTRGHCIILAMAELRGVSFEEMLDSFLPGSEGAWQAGKRHGRSRQRTWLVLQRERLNRTGRIGSSADDRSLQELVRIVNTPFVLNRLRIKQSDIQGILSADPESNPGAMIAFLALLEGTYKDGGSPFDELFRVTKFGKLALDNDLAAIFRYNLLYVRRRGCNVKVKPKSGESGYIRQDELEKYLHKEENYIMGLEKGAILLTLEAIDAIVSILASGDFVLDDISAKIDKDKVSALLFETKTLEEARRIAMAVQGINGLPEDMPITNDTSYKGLIDAWLYRESGEERSRVSRIEGAAYAVLRYNLRLLRRRGRPSQKIKAERTAAKSGAQTIFITTGDIGYCMHATHNYARHLEMGQSPSLIAVHILISALCSKNNFRFDAVPDAAEDRFEAVKDILFNKDSLRQARDIIMKVEEIGVASGDRRMTKDASYPEIAARAMPDTDDETTEWRLSGLARDVLGYNLRLLRARACPTQRIIDMRTRGGRKGIIKTATVTGDDIAAVVNADHKFAGNIENRAEDTKTTITTLHALALALASKDNFTLDDLSGNTADRFGNVVRILFDAGRLTEVRALLERIGQIDESGFMAEGEDGQITVTTDTPLEQITRIAMASERGGLMLAPGKKSYSIFHKQIKALTGRGGLFTTEAISAKLHITDGRMVHMKNSRQKIAITRLHNILLVLSDLTAGSMPFNRMLDELLPMDDEMSKSGPGLHQTSENGTSDEQLAVEALSAPQVHGEIHKDRKTRLFSGYSEAELDALLSYTMDGSITIQITKGCGNACPICAIDARAHPIVHMEFTLVEELLLFLKSRGVKKVNLHMDNEPFEYYDAKSGKDLSDILMLINRMGMSVGVNTHGCPGDPSRAERIAAKIASLDFPVSIDLTVDAYHPDILNAKSDEELKEAIRRRIESFDRLIEMLLPKLPQLKLLAGGYIDQEEGRIIPSVAAAEEAFGEHMISAWGGRLPAVYHDDILWIGRASDLLKSRGLYQDASRKKIFFVGDQPVLVLGPSGTIDFVYADQRNRRHERISDIFGSAGHPEFKPFVGKLQAILSAAERLRETTGYVRNKDDADIYAVFDIGQENAPKPFSGLSGKEINYFYDMIHFAAGRKPHNVIFGKLSDDRLNRIFAVLKDIYIPLELTGRKMESKSEFAYGEPLPQDIFPVWDFTAKFNPDYRATAKYYPLGRYITAETAHGARVNGDNLEFSRPGAGNLIGKVYTRSENGEKDEELEVEEESPAGSIYAVLKYLLDNSIDSPEKALRGSQIASEMREKDPDDPRSLTALSVQALLFHMKIIDIVPGSGTGMAVQYYIPRKCVEACRLLLPAFAKFAGDNSCPSPELLRNVYMETVLPALRQHAGGGRGDRKRLPGIADGIGWSGEFSYSVVLNGAVSNIETIEDLIKGNKALIFNSCFTDGVLYIGNAHMHALIDQPSLRNSDTLRGILDKEYLILHHITDNEEEFAAAHDSLIITARLLIRAGVPEARQISVYARRLYAEDGIFPEPLPKTVGELANCRLMSELLPAAPNNTGSGTGQASSNGEGDAEPDGIVEPGSIGALRNKTTESQKASSMLPGEIISELRKIKTSLAMSSGGLSQVCGISERMMEQVIGGAACVSQKYYETLLDKAKAYYRNIAPARFRAIRRICLLDEAGFARLLSLKGVISLNEDNIKGMESGNEEITYSVMGKAYFFYNKEKQGYGSGHGFAGICKKTGITERRLQDELKRNKKRYERFSPEFVMAVVDELCRVAGRIDAQLNFEPGPNDIAGDARDKEDPSSRTSAAGTYAQRLLAAIKIRSISMREAARQAGVSRQALEGALLGTVKPQEATRMRLEHAFGVVYTEAEGTSAEEMTEGISTELFMRLRRACRTILVKALRNNRPLLLDELYARLCSQGITIKHKDLLHVLAGEPDLANHSMLIVPPGTKINIGPKAVYLARRHYIVAGRHMKEGRFGLAKIHYALSAFIAEFEDLGNENVSETVEQAAGGIRQSSYRAARKLVPGYFTVDEIKRMTASNLDQIMTAMAWYIATRLGRAVRGREYDAIEKRLASCYEYQIDCMKKDMRSGEMVAYGEDLEHMRAALKNRVHDFMVKIGKKSRRAPQKTAQADKNTATLEIAARPGALLMIGNLAEATITRYAADSVTLSAKSADKTIAIADAKSGDVFELNRDRAGVISKTRVHATIGAGKGLNIGSDIAIRADKDRDGALALRLTAPRRVMDNIIRQHVAANSFFRQLTEENPVRYVEYERVPDGIGLRFASSGELSELEFRKIRDMLVSVTGAEISVGAKGLTASFERAKEGFGLGPFNVKKIVVAVKLKISRPLTGPDQTSANGDDDEGPQVSGAAVALRQTAVMEAMEMLEARSGPFLGNLAEEDELVESMFRAIRSIAISHPAKTVPLAFHEMLAGKAAPDGLKLILQKLRRKIEEEKERDKSGSLFKNVEIMDPFSSEEDLRKKLSEIGVNADGTEDSPIFVFAPKGAGMGRSGAGKACQLVIIEDGQFNSVESFYPLLQVVTIALAKYQYGYTKARLKGILARHGTNLEAINIADIVDDREETAFLIVTLSPNIKNYEAGKSATRYSILAKAVGAAV